MGIEFRRVPPGWEHPKDENGRYIPLLGRDFQEDYDDQEENIQRVMREQEMTRVEAENYCGSLPCKESYMPRWSSEEATMWMIYEDTSEGTPVSTAFECSVDLYI